MVVSLMMIYQTWQLLAFFMQFRDVTYKANYGPLEFEGLAALLAMWMPPIALLVLSSVLLIGQRQHPNASDSHPIEAGIAEGSESQTARWEQE